MKTLEDQYPKQELCAAFEVSRSGYCRWRKAALSARKEEDARIGKELCEIHAQSRKTYGRPRLRAALAKKGWRCSQKRVGRLMRLLGLRGVQRGRFRPQTTRSGDRAPAPNLLLNRETPKQPGKVWVADITYIPTREGWLYLAGVMDQGSRRILGIAFDTRLDNSLCEAALRQALKTARPTQAIIHHSDQGNQYASNNYRKLLREKKIIQSMSRRANCYDNAHMESFWATLKTECLSRKPFATRAEARLAIFGYIHTFYNRVRLHSALGFQSPVDFEQINH